MVAALGLPINDLFRYALLVVATVLFVVGGVTVRRKPWLGAVAAVALCVLAQFWLAAPRIDEGHNVFIVDGAGRRARSRAAARGLPSDGRRIRRQISAGAPLRSRAARLLARPGVSRTALRLFRRRHLRWRGLFAPGERHRFLRSGVAAPRLHQRAPLQLVRQSATSSAHARAARCAVLHPWRLEMPYFVMYRFPADFVGSGLCWRGEVLWEGTAEQFEPISHAAMQCRTLAR